MTVESGFKSIGCSQELVSYYKAIYRRLIDEEYLKEKISVDEVIFFYKSRSKELAQKKHFYFLVSMLRDILLS